MSIVNRNNNQKFNFINRKKSRYIKLRLKIQYLKNLKIPKFFLSNKKNLRFSKIQSIY